MSAAPYITRPEDVTCSGWVKVDAIWVSHEPLRDKATGLYARLTWQGAVDACASVGGRLIYADEVDALFDEADAGRALCLTPITLPDAKLCADAGVPFDWVHHGAELETFLTANMGGLAWAEYHDAKAAEQLAALGWDGIELVVNLGKLWVGGARVRGQLSKPPPGRAWLYGWRNAKRVMIQPKPAPGSRGPHGALDEHDYGTMAEAVSETDPA